MARATPYNVTEAERLLLMETEPKALAQLDEDALIALHERVRRARTKHVGQHRRQAARAVESKGARGKANLDRRSVSKAEVFEEALARVSRALSVAAAASAKQLKAERIAAARGERAGAARSAGPGPTKAPASRTSARTRRPVEKKSAAATRASGKRAQAKRDSR
jgi:hypothetical protein